MFTAPIPILSQYFNTIDCDSQSVKWRHAVNTKTNTLQQIHSMRKSMGNTPTEAHEHTDNVYHIRSLLKHRLCHTLWHFHCFLHIRFTITLNWFNRLNRHVIILHFQHRIPTSFVYLHRKLRNLCWFVIYSILISTQNDYQQLDARIKPNAWFICKSSRIIAERNKSRIEGDGSFIGRRFSAIFSKSVQSQVCNYG